MQQYHLRYVALIYHNDPELQSHYALMQISLENVTQLHNL